MNRLGNLKKNKGETMSQTSYSINQDPFFKGMKADSRYDFVATGIAEGAVGFGLGLERGTDPEYQVNVINDAGDTFYGIAVYEESQTTGNYPDTKPVNVMRQGAVVVETTVAVNAGEAAYVDPASGNFTNVSTSMVATGGTFVKTIGAAGLTVVEINLP
jgi:hypothetical protein